MILNIKKKKYINLIIFFLSNFLLIFILFYINNGWLFVLIFITPAHIRDSLCAIAQIIYYIKYKFYNTITYTYKKDLNKNIIGFIPCYSEYVQDILLTLDTIINQKNINDCNIFFIIIVDGIKIGKKNKYHLYKEFHNIFKINYEYKYDYTTWKNNNICINISLCDYKGYAVILLGKMENNGKKCSLILGEELLSDLFHSTTFLNNFIYKKNILSYLMNIYNINSLDFIFHTDADTIIDEYNFYYLLNDIINTESDGCCGFVKVNFNNAHLYCNLWNNLQYTQYFGDQLLKRGLESILNLVTCMPGCNTMLNAKSNILSNVIKDYKRLPQKNHLIQTISRMIGTDRCYTKALLKNNGKIIMSLNSYIYTECPQKLSVFLSQRKRWNSNALSNAYCCLVSKKIGIFNKINSLIDIIRLYFTIFRLGSVIGFYMMIYKIDLIQIIFIIIFVAPSQLYIIFNYFYFEKKYTINLLIGYLLNKLVTPLLSVIITIKLMLYLDDFSWGKTIQLKDNNNKEAGGMMEGDLSPPMRYAVSPTPLTRDIIDVSWASMVPLHPVSQSLTSSSLSEFEENNKEVGGKSPRTPEMSLSLILSSLSEFEEYV